MNILITILIVIALIFCLTFIAGMLFAAFGNRKKAQRAQSIVSLAQLPQKLIPKLVSILQAQKASNPAEVNKIVETIDNDLLDELFQWIRPENRPTNLSAGNSGDNLSWIAMEKSLNEQGYTIKSSKVVTGILLFHLDKVLTEIAETKQ